jgi:hypothetical protein
MSAGLQPRRDTERRRLAQLSSLPRRRRFCDFLLPKLRFDVPDSAPPVQTPPLGFDPLHFDDRRIRPKIIIWSETCPKTVVSAVRIEYPRILPNNMRQNIERNIAEQHRLSIEVRFGSTSIVEMPDLQRKGRRF